MLKQPPATYECWMCGGVMTLTRKVPAPHLGVYMPCFYTCSVCGIEADVCDDFNCPEPEYLSGDTE